MQYQFNKHYFFNTRNMNPVSIISNTNTALVITNKEINSVYFFNGKNYFDYKNNFIQHVNEKKVIL